MQNLLVSMVRLSTVLTLYGLEQIQSSVTLTQKGQNPLKVFDEFEAALNSLADALVDRMGEGRKSALESVTSMAHDLVSTSFSGVDAIDPRHLLRATDELLKSSSEAVAEWTDRTGAKDGDEPKPAADILP